MSVPSETALLKEYDVVTQQFRALTDIRFKLLAFLPLGTIGSLSILNSVEKVSSLTPALAIFGFFVTIAIFVYNLRNDQHYDELVSRAAQIEREVRLFDGSFAQRPTRWRRLGPGLFVEHRWPIDLVYVSSAALWLWVALQPLPLSVSGVKLNALVVVAFVLVIFYHLRRSENSSSDRYSRAVCDAMDLLVKPGIDAEHSAAAAGRALARYLGKHKAGRFEKRILFYLEPKNAAEFLPYGEAVRLDERTASYILAQTIDMPARWIRDIYTGRRGDMSHNKRRGRETPPQPVHTVGAIEPPK